MVEETTTATTPPMSSSDPRPNGRNMSSSTSNLNRATSPSSIQNGTSTPPAEEDMNINKPELTRSDDNEKEKAPSSVAASGSHQGSFQSQPKVPLKPKRGGSPQQTFTRTESASKCETPPTIVEEQPKNTEGNDSRTNGKYAHLRLSETNEDRCTSPATSTDSTATTADQNESLNFAKRQISKNQGRHSYSQLSLMTSQSPSQSIEPTTNVPAEPELQKDDQERIRNPASAAFHRSPEGEEIGFREPFGAKSDGTHGEGGSSSSKNNGESRRGSGTSSSDDTSTSPRTRNSPRLRPGGLASPLVTGPNSARNSPHTTPYVPTRLKAYEPARVVLHKSELNSVPGTPGAKPATYYFTGGSSTSEMNSAHSSYLDLGRRNSSVIIGNGDHSVVSPSLVQSLASSPEEAGGTGIRGKALKHICQPKHPMYIPAVLRPTEETAYDSDTSLGSARGSIIGGAGVTAGGAPGALRPLKPTTRHWMRDDRTRQCGACAKDFTWFRRRHHCRKCGGIFCASDSSRTIGLDRILNFNVLGVPCRACDNCATEFNVFCLDAPRLSDAPVTMQQPQQAPEQEEVDVVGGGDWSTF